VSQLLAFDLTINACWDVCWPDRKHTALVCCITNQLAG